MNPHRSRSTPGESSQSTNHNKHSTTTEVGDLHQRTRGSPKVPIVRYPNAGPGCGFSSTNTDADDAADVDSNVRTNNVISRKDIRIEQMSQPQEKVMSKDWKDRYENVTENYEKKDDVVRKQEVDKDVKQVVLDVLGQENGSSSISQDTTVLNNDTVIHNGGNNMAESMDQNDSTRESEMKNCSLDQNVIIGNETLSLPDQNKNNINNTSSNVIDLTNATISNQERKCLTWPKDAVANNGLDNQEGYLIVHTMDILVANSDGGAEAANWLASFGTGVSTKVNTLDFSSNTNMKSDGHPTRYEVCDVLGQGTFAQVFKCRNVSTGEMVAIKIVKNKPAYVRQAAIEVDIFRALGADSCYEGELGVKRLAHKSNQNKAMTVQNKGNRDVNSGLSMVHLRGYFKFANHLCLVFDLLGPNLYEVLKRRQFRGLPLPTVRSLIQQSMNSLKELANRHVVHCDLKPENILLQDQETMKHFVDAGGGLSNLKSMCGTEATIRLIDFGSACFEGRSTHTYIQSRFYRSPEVLLGLPYDSAIDMWSLGCVAAELFLGLPILPGIHEHDQLVRIVEMIAPLPEWMLDEGSKTKKYFTPAEPSYNRYPFLAHHHPSLPLPPNKRSPPLNVMNREGSYPNSNNKWRLKSRDEYNLFVEHERKKNTNGSGKGASTENNNVRYFKSKRLEDIIFDHGRAHFSNASPLEQRGLMAFVHFLKCMLEPNPWKRLTGLQALQHPFLTETFVRSEHPSNQTSSLFTRGIADWKAPWDPSIWERKQLYDRNKKQKHQTSHNQVMTSNVITNTGLPASVTVNTNIGLLPSSNQALQPGILVRGDPISPEFSAVASRVTAMTDAMSLSQQQQQQQQSALPLHAPFVSRPTPPPYVTDQQLNPSVTSTYMSSPVTHGYAFSSSQMPMISSSYAGYVPQTPQQHGISQPHLYNATMGNSNAINMYQHASSWMGINSVSDRGINGNVPSILNHQTSAMHISTPSGIDPSLHAHLAHNGSNFLSRIEHGSQYMYGTPNGIMPPPQSSIFPMSMHAQSYSDAYSSYGSRQLNDDFGYALQRPGVLPATNEPYGANGNEWRQHVALHGPPNIDANDAPGSAFDHSHQQSFASSSYQPGIMHHSPYTGVNNLPKNGLRRKSLSETNDGIILNEKSPFHDGNVVTDRNSQGTSLLAQQLALAESSQQVQNNNVGHLHSGLHYDFSQQTFNSEGLERDGYNIHTQRSSITDHMVASKAIVSDGEYSNHPHIGVNYSQHLNSGQHQLYHPPQNENQSRNQPYHNHNPQDLSNFQ